MKRRSRKYKKHLLARSRHIMQRLKYRVQKKYIIDSSFTFPHIPKKTVFIELEVPSIFKLQYQYVEAVLEFISKLKGFSKRHSSIGINILMNKVTDIGEGAIAMLLSVLEEFKEKRVLVRGNKPENKSAKDILEKSGFFKYVGGIVSDQNKVTKNTILKTGAKGTHQKVLAVEIRKAMETVWGIYGRNPCVYSTTVEMMRNSCDHAFKRPTNIKWHLAVTHDEGANLVKFSFVDNGKGIIRTFTEQSLLVIVLHYFKDTVDLLETAFTDGIESRTGLSWRGKGLPTIFENYTDGYIRNLVVICNDIYIDFDNNIKVKLKVPFNGTYYYWIVDKNCKKACFTN